MAASAVQRRIVMEHSSWEMDRSPTIVMVDDNLVALEVAVQLFSLYLPGWKVLTTSAVGPGIPYQVNEITNQLTGPAIFLVDFHMPKVNGLALIREIKPYLLVPAKFMLVTAETSHKVYVQALEMGVDVFCKVLPVDEEVVEYNFGELFVAKIKMLAMELSSLAEKTLDEITTAYTRRGFGDQWVQMSNVMKRDHSWGVLIFFDVNDFKVVNDHYQEHEPGNKILRAIYKALRQHLRLVDPIGRMGDEFFAAVRIEVKEYKADDFTRKTLDEIREEVQEQGRVIGERIQKSVSELRVEVKKGEIRTTSISFGVAVVSPFELLENPENLRAISIAEMENYLKVADQASYTDKLANYERLMEAGNKPAEKKYLYYKGLRETAPQAPHA